MTKYLLLFLLIPVCLNSASINRAMAEETASIWREIQDEEDDRPGEAEFSFIRGIYSNYTDNGFGLFRGPEGGWWQTDYDEAERNFLRGLQRYTTLDTNSFSYKALALTDSELFEHTFLYINMKRLPLLSGNGPNFKPDEAKALREFMLKGGFVMLDDFWGPDHWSDFLVELRKIFPKRKLHKLDSSHPVFHIFFDIDEIPQVPGRAVTWDYGSGFSINDPEYPPAVHAILDDDERIMLVANFNTDLGDGWEHTFYEAYPTEYCNEAYKLGINFVVYAMSH